MKGCALLVALAQLCQQEESAENMRRSFCFPFYCTEEKEKEILFFFLCWQGKELPSSTLGTYLFIFNWPFLFPAINRFLKIS